MARKRPDTPSLFDSPLSESSPPPPPPGDTNIALHEAAQSAVPELRPVGHHVAGAAGRARRPQAGAAPHPLQHVHNLHLQDGKQRKCAKVIGDVMGNYHPHGDAAIYDALVRMAQSLGCATR